MLFAGGACSQGPGMVVNDELKVNLVKISSKFKRI